MILNNMNKFLGWCLLALAIYSAIQAAPVELFFLILILAKLFFIHDDIQETYVSKTTFDNCAFISGEEVKLEEGEEHVP